MEKVQKGTWGEEVEIVSHIRWGVLLLGKYTYWMVTGSFRWISSLSKMVWGSTFGNAHWPSREGKFDDA